MPSKERMYPSRRSCGRFRLASFMQVARRFLLTALCAGLPSVNVCQPLYSRLISLRVVRLHLMASIRTSPNWFLRFYTRVFDKRSTFGTSVESRSIIHKLENLTTWCVLRTAIRWWLETHIAHRFFFTTKEVMIRSAFFSVPQYCQ